MDRGAHVITGTMTSTAVAHRQLPRFDVTIMEHFLCDNPSLRDDCYELFRQHPELLPPDVERLSKEQHRELVRSCLRTILAAGYSPVRDDPLFCAPKEGRDGEEDFFTLNYPVVSTTVTSGEGMIV